MSTFLNIYVKDVGQATYLQGGYRSPLVGIVVAPPDKLPAFYVQPESQNASITGFKAILQELQPDGSYTDSTETALSTSLIEISTVLTKKMYLANTVTSFAELASGIYVLEITDGVQTFRSDPYKTISLINSIPPSLLLESGSYLLLEDGAYLLLEN